MEHKKIMNILMAFLLNFPFMIYFLQFIKDFKSYYTLIIISFFIINYFISKLLLGKYENFIKKDYNPIDLKIKLTKKTLFKSFKINLIMGLMLFLASMINLVIFGLVFISIFLFQFGYGL